MKKQFRILSIDAMSEGQNCPECGSMKLTDGSSHGLVKCLKCSHEFDTDEGINWSWNSWSDVSTFYVSEYGELTETSAMKCFADKLSTSVDKLSRQCEIDDDQYNLVLIRKTDRMPLYAIEYGNEN